MSDPTPPTSNSAGTTPPPSADAPETVNLYANPVSFVGFCLVGIGLLLILTFALFSGVVGSSNPYLDIIGFMILPGIFITGLAIVPLGMLLKLIWLRRQAQTYQITYRLPHLDLNNRRTRGWIVAFLAFSFFVVLPVIAVTSYEGFHYTESTEFCGSACHSVMEPQGTAHANSPHARVTCAECHIGSGADWFVKSKISGMRQVFAVWLDTYSRPIPPAITELRPARDTCEECHWPEKFYGSRLQEVIHYAPDEENTRRVVRMLLKVGGADHSIGRVEGIHMHMMKSGSIEYVATDEMLQEIPWVRYTNDDGNVRIFRSDGLPHDAPRPDGILRAIDCMDCHNRGAHHFRSPQTALNLALDAEHISPTLPYIKREGVRILLNEYADVTAADEAIAEHITAFYRDNYADIWADRRSDVDQAVAGLQTIYRRNFFPEMKVDWRTYPENIGHLESSGCFRCHDGLHFDAAGVPISSTCETCHTFLNPLPDNPNTFEVGEFQHSMSLAMHPQLRCDECHSGGELKLCRDCHANMDWLEKRGEGRFRTPASE